MNVVVVAGTVGMGRTERDLGCELTKVAVVLGLARIIGVIWGKRYRCIEVKIILVTTARCHGPKILNSAQGPYPTVANTGWRRALQQLRNFWRGLTKFSTGAPQRTEWQAGNSSTPSWTKP